MTSIAKLSARPLVSLALFAAALLLLGGCATSTTGPMYMQFKPSEPKLEPTNGRIYLYRTSMLGAAVQPPVKVNDEVVGSSQPRGFFFVDRKPGEYVISTTTEVERKLSLTLEAGQTRYVRLNISIGFFVGHVYPELVDNAAGEREIKACHYTGRRAPQTP